MIARLPEAEFDAANAARIVACVNACEGIDNPEHLAREDLKTMKEWKESTNRQEENSS